MLSRLRLLIVDRVCGKGSFSATFCCIAEIMCRTDAAIDYVDCLDCVLLRQGDVHHDYVNC